MDNLTTLTAAEASSNAIALKGILAKCSNIRDLLKWGAVRLDHRDLKYFSSSNKKLRCIKVSQFENHFDSAITFEFVEYLTIDFLTNTYSWKTFVDANPTIRVFKVKEMSKNVDVEDMIEFLMQRIISSILNSLEALKK